MGILHYLSPSLGFVAFAWLEQTQASILNTSYDYRFEKLKQERFVLLQLQKMNLPFFSSLDRSYITAINTTEGIGAQSERIYAIFRKIHNLAKENLSKEEYRAICSIYSRDDISRYIEFNQAYQTQNENHALNVLAQALKKEQVAIPANATLEEIKEFFANPSNNQTLQSVTNLDMSDQGLKCIPKQIMNLTNLRVLDLRKNELEDVPDFIGNLLNLRWLSLSNNNLESLPDNLKNLKKLRSLCLKYNNFKNLPHFIGDFPNLEELNVENNQLTTLPDSVGNLTNLWIISAKHNMLTFLPPSIVNLKHLGYFLLKDNNLNPLSSEMESFLISKGCSY
jgi:Leucine-rich repeat (LRR) protein